MERFTKKGEKELVVSCLSAFMSFFVDCQRVGCLAVLCAVSVSEMMRILWRRVEIAWAYQKGNLETSVNRRHSYSCHTPFDILSRNITH